MRVYVHVPYFIPRRRDRAIARYQVAKNMVSAFPDVHHSHTIGGKLESERWFLNRVTWHDLGLASRSNVLLCVERMDEKWPTFYTKIVCIESTWHDYMMNQQVATRNLGTV